MLVMFIVYVAPGQNPALLLTEETLKDTQAQVMTTDQARKVGFEGLPAELGADVRVIVVNNRDKGRILNNLEASPAAARFSVHDIDA